MSAKTKTKAAKPKSKPPVVQKHVKPAPAKAPAWKPSKIIETRAKRDSITYQKMRADFVEGIIDDEGVRREPTYPELSIKYSVPISTIKRICRKGVPMYGVEGMWIAARDKYRLKIDKLATKKRAKLAVLDMADQDDRHARQAHVIEDAAFLGMMETTRDGGHERLTMPPRFRRNLSAAGVQALSSVWERAIGVSRRIRGEADAIVDVHMDGEVAVEVREELPPEIRDLPAMVRAQFLQRVGNELARAQSKIRENKAIEVANGK